MTFELISFFACEGQRLNIYLKHIPHVNAGGEKPGTVLVLYVGAWILNMVDSRIYMYNYTYYIYVYWWIPNIMVEGENLGIVLVLEGLTICSCARGDRLGPSWVSVAPFGVTLSCRNTM